MSDLGEWDLAQGVEAGLGLELEVRLFPFLPGLQNGGRGRFADGTLGETVVELAWDV